MTETERGLLQAIHDDIDDDAVRLVYADFLEEKGDPRGEFIRLQVLRRQSPDYSRYQAPSPREQELLERHGDGWRGEARPFHPDKFRLDFERGFLASACIELGEDEDLEVLGRLPGLREVELRCCEIGPVGLAHVASLKYLRELVFDSDTRLGAAALTALESLPPWTRVRCDGAFQDPPLWAAFQERRAARIDALGPAQRREAALRFLATLTRSHGPFTQLHISQESLFDAELRFIREIHELESLDLFELWGLTGAGLRHLAGLPNLRSARIFKVELDSIRPLTECPALEVLETHSYWDSEITDEGTEGLDRLTNLRVLKLESDAITEATVRRLGPLRQLRELNLGVGQLADETCLEVLAGLTELESLSLHAAGGLSDAVLRNLSPLRKLHTLSMSLGEGSGEGLRHLAGLTGLGFLQLSGPAVTDAGIAHLDSLHGLRTLMAQYSSITEAGARALAARLPGVTIILEKHVVKSPCPSMTFRRTKANEWVSLLLPEHWGRRNEASCEVVEDGWEHIGSWSGGVVGPVEIRLYPHEPQPTPSAEQELDRHVQNNSHAGPRVLERSLIGWPPWESASCIYENSFGRYFVCVGVSGRRVVSLTCSAPPSRFEQFRQLFLLVARSVRLGDAAKDGVDDRIEIPVADFDTFPV